MKNYTRKGRKWTIDPTMLKGWEELFDTMDKSVVEDECRKNSIDFNWKDNDTLKMVNREEAIQYHPETNDPVWFNHVQVVAQHHNINIERVQILKVMETVLDTQQNSQSERQTDRQTDKQTDSFDTWPDVL